MACNILTNQDGTNTIIDSKGNPSILYDNLLQLLSEYPYTTSELIPTNDINNLALQYYELSNTPEFRSKYNLTSKLDVEVSIDDIINHIRTEYSFNENVEQGVKEGVEELFNANPELANEVYDILGFKTLENNNLEKDIKNLIKNRENIPSSVFLSFLIQNQLVPKIQEYVTSVSHRGGEWNPLYNRLTLNYTVIQTPSEKAKLIAHELMHSLSHKYITAYEALKDTEFKNYIERTNKNEKRKGTNRQIEIANLTKEQIEAFDNLVRIKQKVFDFIKEGKYKSNDKLLKADFGSLNYAFSDIDKKEDIHEFISEVFSNPILIDVLKQIPSEGNKSSLFEDFIKALMNVLGFSNQSVIEDILYYSEKAFIKNAIQESNEKKQQALQLYSQYLDTIFPDSKVKDIVYHGSIFKKLEEVDKNFYVTYYTDNLEYIKSFNLKNKYISAAIVNINNPLYTNKPIADAPSEDTTYTSPIYTEDIYDSVIGKDAGQIEGNTIAVKNNVVDTHILGSKQDIQGFKEFVGSNVIPEVENVSEFGVNTTIDIPKVDKLSDEDKRKELDILLNAINKLKRDKVYSEKTINTITQMMRDIGFNMGSFEEIVAKSKRPYLKKENAIVDITAKMIHLSEGGTVSDLLEEIGHIISAQLDGVEFEKALEIIKNDPKYTNEMQKYISIYQSEEKYTGEDAINKAATEVLGQLIGNQLADKLEENTDSGLVSMIKRFIKSVLGVFKNKFELHTYVAQSVDYFIKTPNKPFKRETHYYSLDKKRNELSDVIVNLKRQRSKVLQLKSKFDKTDGLFESDKRKVVLDKQITFLTQEIMNNNTDRNVIDYLNEVLNDTNEIVTWLSDYKVISILDYKVNVTGEEKELKQFVSNPYYKDGFDISQVSIRALSDARDYVHNYTYITTVLDNIVSNNVRLTEGEKLSISTYITNINSRLTFINNEVENLDKLKSQELIESLVKETGVAYDYKDLPQSIKNTLQDYEQEKDINAAEVWFGPMGMVNSTLSRLVDGVFNLIYNNARIKTIDFSNTFLNKFKSYIGKDMSFIAEKYDGKTTGDFIDEYHWGQWNIARKTKLEELAKDDKYNFPKDAFDRGEEFDSVKVYNDYKKELKVKLKELQDELEDAGKLTKKSKALQENVKKIEDLIKHYDAKSEIIDSYLEEIGKWYNDNTQPRHNVNEIIDHYKTILSKDDFNIWYERNVIVNSKNIVMYYKGELIQPSNAWKNKDFSRLNAEQKRIVAELKTYKKEFDDMVGLPSNTLMPQMYQSMLNSLYDGKLSNIGTNLGGQLKRAFTRTSDDTQFEPDQEMRHFQEDNRIVSYIGSRYTKRLNNPEHISTDILGSMIGYAQMAYEFKEKMQRIDQFELIAQKMKKTKYANTSNKLSSNSLERLTNHLEVHMMGKEEKVREIDIPGTNLKINVNKVVAKFNKFISHTNLAFGGITQLANIITSNINGLLETILGQHITGKSVQFALKEFTKLYSTETIKEFGKTIKTNKLDLMMRYFGLSESADATFNDLDKHILMRKPVSNVAYAGYEAGSYYINGIALISILNNNRFYDGKLYTEQAFKDLQNNISFDSLPSAYDSIVVKNGKLELLGLKASELNLLINKVRDLSKKLDGKLTKEDYAMAHTNIVGMSALMHRNWMIDGAFRRMKARGLNFKTGEIDEGYWVTTLDLMSKFLYSKEKLKVLANLRANYKKLSRDQQLGLNRTLLDLASIGTMIAVAGFIFNGGDDDDDESSQFLAYLSNRVLLEVSSFYNPFEILYAVTDPIVSARQMETLMHLGNAINFEEIERGKWEGYTRAEKYWYSLIPGVKGYMQTQDTESSNQFLKNKQLSWLY